MAAPQHRRRSESALTSWKPLSKPSSVHEAVETARHVPCRACAGGPRVRGAGALANAKLVEDTFPGWRLRFYHDGSVPSALLTELRAASPAVQLVDVTRNNAASANPRAWRLAVASDPTVGRWLVRDVDARLSARDKAAVDEWVASGRRFSVMRDHPGQTRFPINAGMMGGTRDAMPCLERLVLSSTSAGLVPRSSYQSSLLFPYKNEGASAGHPLFDTAGSLDHTST